MRLYTLLAALAVGFHSANAAGLLAIDYGTEWMKVSLVKPGVPFDVLLNTDSKRKIQSVAALKGDDRWIGGDAINLASRFPDATYPNVKLLIGHDTKHLHAKVYESIYRRQLHNNATAGKIQYQDPTSFSDSGSTSKSLNNPEEYLAMQLSHAKKLAKTASGEAVVDAIVTVPAFFTYAERKAMLDAIELAGLKPLALLDDGSAVAVNFAMTRSFPSEGPEYHLFYDAGAASIRATVVALQSKEVKDDPASKITKNVTSVDIKGVGWDLSAGGLHMDGRIRDILELQFLTGAGQQLEAPFAQNRRAQAKLLKEASRVKQVLSANAQSPSRIEGLVDEIDFSGSVTRQAFEAACQDMKPAFTRPIQDALAAAGVTLDDIASVILVGGTSRVPMVQDAVTDLVGADKIGKNLNADEAAVMGAALYGAGISRQFRTKDIRLTGLNPHAIVSSYPADSSSGAEPRIISSTLFAANSKLGVQKTLTLKKTTDFNMIFKYKNEERPFSQYKVSGLTEAYANLTEAERSNATVAVTVVLNESNMLKVPSATLEIPGAKEGSSVADKIKEFFAGKDKDEAGDPAATEESKEAETDKPATPSKAKGPIRLAVVEEEGAYKSLSEQEKRDSLQRLRDIDNAETRKRNREEARNGLEAYTYKLRDQLESAAFAEASTESERIAIRKKLEEANEWMWDEGETAPTKDLKSAKSELERAAAAPINRLKEAAERPKAISDLRMGLVQAQAFLISATEQLKKDTAADEPSKYTEAELKALENSISSTGKWLEELSKKQEGLSKNIDPLLKVSELERRKKDLSVQVTLLQSKRPPKRAKKATTSSASTSATASSEESTTAPATTPSESTTVPTPTTTVPVRDEL